MHPIGGCGRASAHLVDEHHRAVGLAEHVGLGLELCSRVDTRAYPVRFIPLYKMYSHHRSQSLGSMSCIPDVSET